MVLMDKIKEHSCAIQPAFGFGGINQLNFAFLFQQLLNPEPLAPVEETLELPPANGTDQLNPTNLLQPQVTTEVADDGHLSIQQILQNQINAQYNFGNPIPPHFLHPNAAGAAVNESNALNVINLTTMLNNSVAVQLLDDDESDDSDVPVYMYQPNTPAPTPNMGGGAYQPHTATAPLPDTQQMVEISAMTQYFVGQNPPQQSPGLQLIAQIIEGSNSSNSPFPAPASTPNYESSEDEDCAPSVESNIIFIDLTADSDSDSTNEDKVDDSNVPNQFS